MGFHGFDADIEGSRRGLGAVMAADFTQHIQLALAEFSDADIRIGQDSRPYISIR